MSLLRRMLANFGLARRLPTTADLERTWPKHAQTLRKADKVLDDYKRQDGIIELRVVRRTK